MRRVDQRRHRLARRQYLDTSLLRLRIAGTELHAAGQQIVTHPVCNAAQHLRAAGIVKVDAVVVQRWKLSAYPGQIESRLGSCHGIRM